MNNPNPLRAFAWMIGAMLSFSVIAISVRELAGAFSTAEIVTTRTGIGLIVTLIIGLARPELLRTIRLHRLGTHFIRNGTHLVAQFTWTLGLTLLPLAAVFALEFTMPAWTTLLAVFLLGEIMTRGRVIVLVCGVIGALIILQPGLETFQPAGLLVLVAAFGYAASNVATKTLTSTESTFAIIFWMGAMQLPIAYAFGDPLFFTKFAPGHILAAAGLGIGGLTAHYCMASALSAADASVVIPLDFLRLPLIAVVGWLAYGEAVELSVFVGAALIMAGIAWNLSNEARQARSRHSPVAR